MDASAVRQRRLKIVLTKAAVKALASHHSTSEQMLPNLRVFAAWPEALLLATCMSWRQGRTTV